MLVLDMNDVAARLVTPAAAAASFTCASRCADWAAIRFLYDSGVSVVIAGSTAKTWEGLETVMPVTLALTAFASAVP
jgi:hypothetical protein